MEQSRPTISILGAGAAGTLTALHLLRVAGRRSADVRVQLVDPADRWARGVAYGTTDDAHLLNVPAGGLSAYPEDPGHFVAWAARHLGRPVEAATFLPRRLFALYLDDVLAETVASVAGTVRLEHLRARATGVRRAHGGVEVVLEDGRTLAADAAVVATGLPSAGHGWAPEALRASPFFVPDPWAPGALDVVRRDHAGPADVLVVGSGLTMVDIVLSVTGAGARSDRVVHVVSRRGRLPAVHADQLVLAQIPDVSDWGGGLDGLVERARAHLDGVRRTTGDWRPGVDGLRFRLAELWARLGEAERERFVTELAGEWGIVRHRMPPSSAALLDTLRATGSLRVDAATVEDVRPLPTGGLEVALTDGSRRAVGWVVNATGPRTDVRCLGEPLLDDLLRERGGVARATIASAGMGFRTDRGRLVDSVGSTDAPLWTLGALRRGELWESTAIPEIRSQASALATSILDVVAPLPRRLSDGRLVGGHHPVARPRDLLGLPLSTTAEAAAAYNAGLERVMRLQAGGEELIREATLADPGFAVGHAALAMLGHEAGADADVAAALVAARDAVARRGDARETSFVEVVASRVQDARQVGAQRLLRHLADHPRDALAVSAAVPTIAFSGVTDVQREAWDLVEGLAPAYGDHWWYVSLLAFVRQDQERFEEAGLLAESALSCEPASGHAVHALTHVLYETGQHQEGRTWLDHWVAESGRSASHRAHFSWHAALHELALGDTEAVRQRYYSQLAPPGVTGVRALVDAASLLWRWQVTTTQWPGSGEAGVPPAAPVLAVVDEDLVRAPSTPFVALHAGIALAASGERSRLVDLRHHLADSDDPVQRGVVATVVDGLAAVLDRDWAAAAERFDVALPSLVQVGGSAAQREIVEETLLLALVEAGETERAATLLDARLDRRASPLDDRRRLSCRGDLVRR